MNMLFRQISRRSFTLIVILIIGGITLQAQDICESLASLKKGTLMEYTTFTKKDKPNGVQRMEITETKEVGNRKYSTVQATFEDKKGKEVTNLTYDFECEDNVFYIDLRNLIDPQAYAGMAAMEMEWDGVANSIPGNLSVGDQLPDANMSMKASSGGISILSMNVDVVDQKVVAREVIETSAGSFDCYKIESTTHIKSIFKSTTNSIQWFSPKVGTIKTENYDKKGKLSSYTLLTRYESAD